MKRPARLYAILARDSPRAVIFRRGPSKQVLLIRWDTANDTFEEGQWFKGRIYERRCDLSPDGELLLYFAGKQGRPPRTWSAISRPPYLTALAFWPKGDAWGGGGHFVSGTEIRLNHRPDEMTLSDDFHVPKWLTIKPYRVRSGWGEDDPVWSDRLTRDGWIRVSEGRDGKYNFRAKVAREFDPPVIWEKAQREYTLQMIIRGLKEREGPWYVCDHVVLDRTNAHMVPLGRTDWADWDHSGDLMFAKEGCLYRARDDFSKPALIIDLNDRSFEERKAPPELVRWPEPKR